MSVTFENKMTKTGKGVVCYRKKGNDYTLEVEFVNGVKEGKGNMYDSKHALVAELVFHNDQLNGECVIRNDNGILVFRGTIMGDKKEGDCYEYDDKGKEIFHGIYKNGCRVNKKAVNPSMDNMVIVNDIKTLKGYYREKSADGTVLSIAQYKQKQKHGRCLEFSMGVLTREALFEKGKLKRVIREFSGPVMREFDKDGNMVYEGSFKGDYKTCFEYEGEGSEYKNKGKDLIYSGSFKDGYHEGHGCYYKNGKVLYEGEWKDGYPCGEGCIYDVNGKVTHSGVWNNGYLYDGKTVIDYQTGEKRKGCYCGTASRRMKKIQRKKKWSKRSFCTKFWLVFLYVFLWIFVVYEIALTLWITIAAISSSVYIYTCEGFTHIPFFLKDQITSLRINSGACYYSPWILTLDLSGFTNLRYLDIDESTFRNVKKLIVYTSEFKNIC